MSWESVSQDFLEQLAGGGMPPQQAAQQPEMHQLIQNAPPQAFQQQVTQALQQTPPQEYQDHVTPGVGGTNPLGNLGKGMLGSLAGSLIGNMLGNQMGGGAGSLAGSLAGSVLGGQAAQGGLGNLVNMLGLSHSDPQQMNADDVAKLAAHAQQNNPGALAATAAQYQNQPDVLHSILGNKALLMAGAGLAAGVLSGQLKPKF